MVLEAARRGHRVFATARDPASIQELASAAGVSALTLDVTDPDSIARVVEEVLRREGRLDALVSNAPPRDPGRAWCWRAGGGLGGVQHGGHRDPPLVRRARPSGRAPAG